MTSPTVSVLVPCRNAERYLAETLDSALAQTQRPLEIIVVDDGSTDGSRALAERYAPAVSLVHGSGRGASAARNQASLMARGDFFQYLDADDLLEPHALATRVEALIRTGADVVISDWERIEEREGTWHPVKRESGNIPQGRVPVDLQVLQGFWAPPVAILYRRRVWDQVGAWRETLPVIQDARFLLDAARTGATFVHLPGVGARYRQHRLGSLSTAGPARFWRDVLQNAREVEALWAADAALDAPHRSVLADVYAQCARVGVIHDAGLFEAADRELRRFPDHPLPKFIRAARLLDRFAGHGPARTVLRLFS